MLLQLSSKQKSAIQAGMLKRNRLIRATKQAANQVNLDEKPIHYYIFGPTGIGKTYLSLKAVKESGVDFFTINGNISMYDFCINLGVIAHQSLNNKIIVLINGCDEILKDAKSISQIKGLLAENKISYKSRVILSTLGEEDSITFKAIKHWQNRNDIGFTVDTSNITFLITSSIKLPYSGDADAIVEKNGGLDNTQSIRTRYLAGIRGTCEIIDLDMTKEEKWGNLASICLEDGACKDCNTEEEKIFILDYIWNNWDNMKETSIRTAEKMARTLKLEGPDGIVDAFNADFLK